MTFNFSGCIKPMSPAQARTANVPFHTLDTGAVITLEALGETLLPGSATAGLALYIDHQLSGDPADSMLKIKYLGVSAPFADFYRAGLIGVDALARTSHGKAFAVLEGINRSRSRTQVVAERVRFELTKPVKVLRFSRPVQSTALPPLHLKNQ